MEVTPEMYAWLTDLNIINPFSSLKSSAVGSFTIPEKTIQLMLGGKYMDIILTTLQSAYNKFYKLKLNYLTKLSELKEITEDQEYISNSIKYANWHLINEMLNQFGISYNEDQINQLINGDREFLLKVITQIYYLCNQFLKERGVKEGKKKSDKNLEPINETASFGNTNLKVNKEKEKEKEKDKDKESNLNDIISEKDFYNETASRKTNTKQLINSNLKSKSNDTVNINNIDPNKNYEDCTTALEFFILSLCKNLDMKPRQAVALLSNNRKYLSIICNKGIKGDFSKIKKWLNDLNLNSEIMIKLINSSDDGLNISFGTIGSALVCNDQEIPVICAQLLNKINTNCRMNWEWFKSEGLDLMLYAVIKTELESDKLTLMNILYEFTQNYIKDFFLELRKKLATSQKKTIFEFFANILPIIKKLNSVFMRQLKEFIFELCLNEKNEDLSVCVTIVADAFYYLSPIEDELLDKITSFFKTCVRSDKKSIYSTSIAQIISLMDNFGKDKNKCGPQLYKSLVFLFLEGYNNEEKREFFLENFENFFNDEQQVPIDIFLEPYINQINSADNYTLCDFEFIFKMIEHPRIESKDIPLILKFIFNVILKNQYYRRTANIILNLIFEKQLIQEKCTPEDMEKISEICENFIKKSFDEFMKSIKPKQKNNKSKEPKENNALLESPYDIFCEDILNLNDRLYEDLIKCIKEYRKIKNKNSNALLAMLWKYPEHDDILLNLEEEFRPIYESAEIEMKKKKREVIEHDKRDYEKQIQNYISEVKNQRINKIENSKTKETKKKKQEDKIKKNLQEQRKIDRIMSGRQPLVNPELLNAKRTNLPKIEGLTKTENNYNENSNMMQAINAATEKYANKGAITSSNQNLKNNYLSSNKVVTYKHRMSEEKKKDDVFEKYGRIETYDMKKRKEENMKIYKQQLRIQLIKNFVLPEGSLIRIMPNGKQEIADTPISRKYAIYMSQNRNTFLPVNLEEEEDREIKAIDGYNYEYRKNIKYYFKCYASELDLVIKKKNLLKLLRDKGISKNKIDLEELNTLIRYLYNENLTEFNFDQFNNLLIHLSYLIYSKVRPSMTISECYGNLLKKLDLQEETESTKTKKNKMQPVIDLLLELKENKEEYNLPEGFKFTIKTKVRYNKHLAPHFAEILGEGKFICYEIIEDLIFDIFNTSLTEPYVNLDAEQDVVIEPDKIHKWTPEVTMAYVQMGKEYKQYGMIACDAFEDGFKNYFKGKNINGEVIVHPQEKKLYEEMKERLKKENRQRNIMFQRKAEIEAKLEEYKQKKKEKRIERKKKIKELRQKKKEEIQLIQEKFTKVQEKRKAQEEEKLNKLLEKQDKMKEKNIKRDQELIEFYHKQRKRIKIQIEDIMKKRKDYISKFQEKKEEKLKSNPKPSYLQKDKEYITFEAKLLETLENLRKREDINSIFNKYNKHLKVIYEVYSKIGYNKISFFSKECIHINEFKQFLINFAVLGLLISTDQMNWIFNKIAKEKQKDRDGQVYLDFDDFQISLCMLAIFSRFTERSRKLLPSDIDSTNGETIEYFFKFLGLKLPYNKLEMENFINDRRALTMKSLLELQRKVRSNVNGYKSGEYVDLEEEKRKEEKKKKMAKERKKKEMEREKGDQNDNEEEEDEGEEEEDDENEKDNNEKSNEQSGSAEEESN